MSEQLRVLIVDDQKVVREGLAMVLSMLDNIEVVGTAVDGADAQRQSAALVPDVILMDLNMPNVDGATATRHITQTQPDVRVVVLTTYADDTSVFSALQAGARGYLTKDSGAAEIERALRAVAAGDAHLDVTVQRRLLEGLLTPSTQQRTSRVASDLTARELDVLERIAEGLSNVEIAAALFVSEATVKTHVNHLLAKTRLRDRAQLVAYAFRTGVAPD